MLLRLVEVASRGHAMSPLLNAWVTLLRLAYATAFDMVEVVQAITDGGTKHLV